MATVTFRLATYKRKDGSQQIQMWVYSGDTQSSEDTGFKVPARQWDKRRGRVRHTHPSAEVMNVTLDAMEQRAIAAIGELKQKGASITAHKVTAETGRSTDFHAYLLEVEQGMTGDTQYYSRKTFATMRKMLLLFRPQLSLEEIDYPFLKDFETFLKARPGRKTEGMADATARKRLIQLRSAYDAHPKAIKPSPLASYKVPSGQRQNDDVPLTEAEIEALWNVPARTRIEREAKDIFLFSYYAAGMRPGDVLSLRWEEVGADAIVYLENKKEHQKKQRTVRVELHPRLQTLLARRSRDTGTVFGLLKSDGQRNLRKEIDLALSGRRDEIKTLAVRAGIADKWVSFKLARTTFAAIANEKSGWNLNAVRVAMNHSTLSMTELYAGRDTKAATEVQRATYGTAPQAAGSTLEIKRYKSE